MRLPSRSQAWSLRRGVPRTSRLEQTPGRGSLLGGVLGVGGGWVGGGWGLWGWRGLPLYMAHPSHSRQMPELSQCFQKRLRSKESPRLITVRPLSTYTLLHFMRNKDIILVQLAHVRTSSTTRNLWSCITGLGHVVTELYPGPMGDHDLGNIKFQGKVKSTHLVSLLDAQAHCSRDPQGNHACQGVCAQIERWSWHCAEGAQVCEIFFCQQNNRRKLLRLLCSFHITRRKFP